MSARLRPFKGAVLALIFLSQVGTALASSPKPGETARQPNIEFIRENKDRPFFLYYASPLPHTKWIPNQRFEGSSEQGTYGDVVQEIDWQVGGLMDTLSEPGLSDNTLVVFASDNGPQLNVEGHGSPGPLRDGKWANFEGGIRAPAIARWPDVVPAGSQNDQIVSIMDAFLADLRENSRPIGKFDDADSPASATGKKGETRSRNLFLFEA